MVTWVARDISGNETRADQLIMVSSLPGDTDLDGDVDEDDAAYIDLGLGERALGYGEVALEDFNGDGLVDTVDEGLRDEIQAYIDSVTVDFRDLNEDDWITVEDIKLLRDLMTSEAYFSLSSDFSILPLQASLLGDAVLDEERLEISSSQTGSLLITPPSKLRKVTGLEVSFTIQYGSDTLPVSGEGLSFSFAPDLPNEAFGEEGAGSGLKISLQLGTSRINPQRIMKIWFNKNLLGTSDDLVFLAGNTYPLKFVLLIHPDNTLSIWLNNDTEHLVFDNLSGYEPIPGSFGIGARSTRFQPGHQWIDDLSINATYEPPASRLRLSVQHSQEGILQLKMRGDSGRSYRIEVSPDLETWSLWQELIVPSEGTELSIDLLIMEESKSQFYRARSN